MEKQDRAARRTDPSPTRGPGDPAELRVANTDVVPIRDAVRSWALQVLVTAYGGNTHQLLTDLADLLEASIAYVGRPTVEAHLERTLSDSEWSAVAAQFTAMAFDEHVGEAGTVRTNWVDDRLHRADVTGRTPAATPPSAPPRRPVRR